jgi:BirA family biotin operon repressor/biotin-[acetyl-CoA-carboxylase] ligase
MKYIHGIPIEWHDELDSTNARAMELVATRDTEVPLLIGATRQTAGRGRGGNTWWSGDGALTFSILFNPREAGLPFLQWPQVALTTGLAVAETLEQFLPPALVQLKWPNDVYFDGRKISGILAEVPPCSTDRLVIGVGVNVSNSSSEAPPDLQSTVISMKDALTESTPSIDDVLMLLIPRWQWWLEQLALGEIDFAHVWKPRCYLTGYRVSIATGPELQMGFCHGLDRDGALLVETDRGRQRILAGTVRRL